jgi:hypothetical protein
MLRTAIKETHCIYMVQNTIWMYEAVVISLPRNCGSIPASGSGFASVAK